MNFLFEVMFGNNLNWKSANVYDNLRSMYKYFNTSLCFFIDILKVFRVLVIPNGQSLIEKYLVG